METREIKELNVLQGWIAFIRFNNLRDDRWYPFPYLGENHIIGKKEVFSTNLIANYPSSHDGQLLGVRRHVSKTLIEQRLWKDHTNIGIYIVKDGKAGPIGLYDRDCEYKLYYLK